jgi:hypothetical protein
MQKVDLLHFLSEVNQLLIDFLLKTGSTVLPYTLNATQLGLELVINKIILTFIGKFLFGTKFRWS